MSQSSKGIVLSKESFGEADLYIQFLTRDWGVVSLLAKSARKSRKRFVGGLDLFCHDEIFVKGDPKERGLLLELSVLNSFTGLREDLDKALCAGKITQWAKKLSYQSLPNPVIYSLLGQTLSLIEKNSDKNQLELICLIFKNKLLSELGLHPRFDQCAKCDASIADEYLFDIASGGILCRSCSGKNHFSEFFKIEPEERLFLERTTQLKLGQVHQLRFSAQKVSYLSRLISQFASFHTQVRLP